MKLLRGSLALACVLACVTSCAPALAAPKLPLGHAGRWITDASGRVVIVHGLNMVYKLPPYYPRAIGFGSNDAAFIARMGFNAVRVGIIWKGLEPAAGVYSNAYLAQIARTVKILSRSGVLSLLDFHQDMYNERFQGEGAPDWAVQDDGLPAVPKSGFPNNYLTMPALQHALDHFWNNSSGPGGPGLQNRYAGAWRSVAKRFRAQRSVLGYELFNEPFPGTAWAGCANTAGCPAFDAKLSAFDQRVAAAIRAGDRQTLVFHEPNVLFNFGAGTHVARLSPGGGFAFHDYCLTEPPSGNGCPTEETVFTNALAQVRKTHEALLLTEFGATRAAGDLTGMVQRADKYMVPWLEWAYCGCNDPTGSGDNEAVVLDPRKPPIGSNVVRSTLRLLVEPYPQVIAGTPISWSFDRTSGVFRLHYSTARVRGRGRFATGAITEISVPRLVYHGRYGVRADGGAIASARGSSLLQVASCPGARRVSVTVRRSGASRGSCRIPLARAARRS